MISEEKVVLMSKMAIFESGKGKDALRICDYTQKDYVYTQVVKNCLLSTVGFVLALFLIGVLSMDAIASLLANMKISILLILLGVLYMLFVILAGIGTRRRAIARYNDAKEMAKEYKEYVLKLNEFYDSETNS